MQETDTGLQATPAIFECYGPMELIGSSGWRAVNYFHLVVGSKRMIERVECQSLFHLGFAAGRIITQTLSNMFQKFKVYQLRRLLECFGWFSDGFLDVLGFQWLLRMVFWSWPEDWLGPGSLRLAAQRGHHLSWTEGEFILDRDLRGKFSEQLGMVKTEAIN